MSEWPSINWMVRMRRLLALRTCAGAAAAARAGRAAIASGSAGLVVFLGHLKLPISQAEFTPAFRLMTHDPRVHYTPPSVMMMRDEFFEISSPFER